VKFEDDEPVPPLVCLQTYDPREGVPKVVGYRDASAEFLRLARKAIERDSVIVGHNLAFDVADNERIIASLSMKSPADGQISLMPNFRVAQGFSRSAPEFKRGDRAWFGAPIAELPDLSSVRMSCRVDEADRARVPPNAKVRVRRLARDSPHVPAAPANLADDSLLVPRVPPAPPLDVVRALLLPRAAQPLRRAFGRHDAHA
jgi:hypothetical protein